MLLLLVLATQLAGGRLAFAAPDPPPANAAQWVQNHRPTELWSGAGPGAVSFGPLRQFSYLRVEAGGKDRLYVYNPRTSNFAYVDVSAVGPSGPPPASYLALGKPIAALNRPGRLVGQSSLYAEPDSDDANWLRSGAHNEPVVVEAQVSGVGEGDWYRLSSGEFVTADQLRLPGPPTAHYDGKWIDADLNEPVMVTAYEGDQIVASMLAIKGVVSWNTPIGTYAIWRRVPNETMSSEGLGIPRNAPGGYYVQNVLFTQYFSRDGAALHYNYWSNNFGYRGSHGCLGLNYDDSVWIWNWADFGTPVVIHE